MGNRHESGRRGGDMHGPMRADVARRVRGRRLVARRCLGRAFAERRLNHALGSVYTHVFS